MLDREEVPMPTTTQRDNDPQSSSLSAIREGQAAVIDVLRVWADIGQQLTRDLRLPVARIDLTDAVDRAFDVAEQTLAVQRQLALTLTGLASRQLETTVDTVAETVDTTVEAADTAVETVQATVRERARQVEAELKGSPERVEQPQGDQDDAPKAEPPTQDRRPDGRPYEERTVEELQERAGELQIEGRSTMNKDELIAALRNHRKSRSAKTDAAKSQPPTQDRPADRRSYAERSIEELRERARELEIEGRSSMTKDELIAALRGQAK
jgi:Rho termination factor, N-terminal domain